MRCGVLMVSMNGAMPFAAISAGAAGISDRIAAGFVGAGKGNSGFCSTGTTVSTVVESRMVVYSYEAKKNVRSRPS